MSDCKLHLRIWIVLNTLLCFCWQPLTLRWRNSFLFFLWRCGPKRAMASSFLRFLEHTKDASQSVGLPWTSDQPVAQTSTWLQTTLNTDRHPCPQRDLNQNTSKRAAVDPHLRPRGHWDRLRWRNSAHKIFKSVELGCLKFSQIS
jgi:hypothetical protein